MSKRLIFAGFAGAAATGVSIGTALALKNRHDLMSARARARIAYAQLEVALTHRRELVLPLLESVQGVLRPDDYGRQSSILTALIEPNGYPGSEAVLSGALAGFFEIARGYPALAVDAGFLARQEQFVSEDRDIEFARKLYLDLAREYNESLGQTPNNLVARLAGLLPEEILDESSGPDNRRDSQD
jgi:hypothetical protein